jgi:hypothetical protein
MTTPFEALVSSLMYQRYEAGAPDADPADVVEDAGPMPFGILYPHAYARQEPRCFDFLQMECVLRGAPDPVIRASARFLQSRGRPHQARERRVRLPGSVAAMLAQRPVESTFAFAAAGPGTVSGRVELSARRAAPGAWFVRLRVENTSVLSGLHRSGARHQDALVHSLLSTHTILRAESGTFVSPLDHDGPLGHLVSSCRNINTWPVLASANDDAMLGAAVVLADHPHVHAESAGVPAEDAASDAALLLHLKQLTPEEQRAIAEQSPEFRQIVDRATGVHQPPGIP